MLIPLNPQQAIAYERRTWRLSLPRLRPLSLQRPEFSDLLVQVQEVLRRVVRALTRADAISDWHRQSMQRRNGRTDGLDDPPK